MNYGCFTSAEGLINLSKKLGTAISKLAASISGIEHDANRIINVCNKLDSYNGKGSKGYPVAVKGGDGSTNYYEMVWEITGQDGTRERVNRALDELNEVKVSLQEQFQKVSKMVANIGEEIASDEDAIEALLGNIAYNKYDAAGHNFISKDKFANTKQYWTDGKLEFADSINGQPLGKDVRVIIKNGVYMGFTTVAAMNAYNNAKSGSSGTAGGPYTANPRIVTNKDIKTKEEEKESLSWNNNSSRHIGEVDSNGSSKRAQQEAISAATTAIGGIAKNFKTATNKNSNAAIKSNDITIRVNQTGGWDKDYGKRIYRNVKLKESTLPRYIKLKNGEKLTSSKYFTDNDNRMHWVFEDKKGNKYISQPGVNKYSKIVNESNKTSGSTQVNSTANNTNNTSNSHDDYLIKKAEQQQKAKTGVSIENSGAKKKINEAIKGLTGSNKTTQTPNTTPQSTFSAKKISPTETAINWAKKIANNDNIGYSQSVREGSSYDCSSLIINAYEKAGVPVKAAGATTTGDMVNAFTKTGKFEYVSGNPNVNNLKPGDIVIKPHHTEMYVGNGKLLGAHGNFDGAAGDSSGKEIDIENYYGTWSGYLRYKGD